MQVLEQTEAWARRPGATVLARFLAWAPALARFPSPVLRLESMLGSALGSALALAKA